ncbi:serine hydrolase domain-containing protein [Gracilibacillus saliphilus]|uniref:serine hydrolase domain-containing protein n=1 Tax=Gracilibacillus saliphilus TaxID=543890 RepID=UPI0013D8474A|nr:serine hydrolase domain-containing protein [Gracilibacillus saliphilus]
MKEKIEMLMQANYELDYFIGNVLVAKGDQILFNESYGMSDYEQKKPHTPSSKFLVGSVSKQFIAAAIMKLQEEGKLHVKDTLDKYLKHYTYAPQITLHHLLTHSSGIPNYTETLEYYLNRTKVHTPEDIIGYFSDRNLLFKPGSKSYYSNSGYVLLTKVIEYITDLSYEEYLDQAIFRPLNMKDTGVLKSGTNIDRPMIGYTGTADGYKEGPVLDISICYGAGGVYSTVEDLYKWDQSLYSDAILSSESRHQLFIKHSGNYGYGWEVSEKSVHHEGGITGFNSLISRYMDEKLVIIILSNRAYYGSRIDIIHQDIRAILDGQLITLPQKKDYLEQNQLNFQKYLGEYLEPNMNIPFSVEYVNERLCIYEAQNPAYPLELKPIKQSPSEDIFSLEMSPGIVSFLKDPEGEVKAVTLFEDGFSVELEKIK